MKNTLRMIKSAIRNYEVGVEYYEEQNLNPEKKEEKLKNELRLCIDKITLALQIYYGSNPKELERYMKET